MHEKSETIQNKNGKWINVYGKGLPKEGQVLPILHPKFEKEEYDTEKEAVASAKQRSDLTPEGMFKDLDYEKEIQAFDDSGKAIPKSESKVVTEAEPKSMEYSEEEILKAEEIANAGNDWKEEFKRMLSAMNKDKPKKDEGMLSTEEESNAKEDQIAKGYHQMPDGSKMKNSEMEEEVSTDVAKDLDDEGRGLKGYKPPSEPEKRGYKQDDGGNYSVDTTDDYWQTKVGYDAAMDLYGTKPAWVKEPSLIYNPKTKKYDPIEKEEFVDLKPKKRISL